MGTLARNNGLKCEKEYELFYGQKCLGKHLVRVNTRITSIMKTYNVIVTATVNFIGKRNLIIQCVKQIFLQSNFRIMKISYYIIYNIIIYQSYFLMSYWIFFSFAAFIDNGYLRSYIFELFFCTTSRRR